MDDWFNAQGGAASRLRQRKYALLRRFQIPRDALPARWPSPTAVVEPRPAIAPTTRDIRSGR